MTVNGELCLVVLPALKFYFTIESDYFNRVGWLYNIFLPLIVTENHCAPLLRNSLSNSPMGVPPSQPLGKHVSLTFSVEALWAAV